MAHCTSISHVGDKLIVGALDTSFLNAFAQIAPGSAILNGPVWIGTGKPIPTANCMIGPGLNPVTLEVTGISNIIGTTDIKGILNVPAVSSFSGTVTINAVETKNGADLKNAVNIGNDTGVFNGPVTINSPLTVNSVLFCNRITSAWLEGELATARALPGKGFDIPHPSKPKTHRLRYICLEGPEVGAYIRGKIENTNIIQLPDYWRDLVYPESITVYLTPLETYQELFVEKIEWGTKIHIKNNLGTSIKCDYIVYGERKTEDKLQPEYEGKTPDDYPGSNEEYSLAGWNYDKR